MCQGRTHAGRLHGHEERVDDDAQRDEEIHEGIHDEEFEVVRELIPAGRTLPPEQDLSALGFDVFLQQAFV